LRTKLARTCEKMLVHRGTHSYASHSMSMPSLCHAQTKTPLDARRIRVAGGRRPPFGR
jgi:hypothetical protein